MTTLSKITPVKLTLMALLAGTSLMLASCQTSGTATTNTSQVDQALERAANESRSNGQESLPLLEKLYKRNPDDTDLAVRYSGALREAGRLNRASIIIAPFARNERKPSAPAKAEFAAVQVALGNYEVAQEFASKAVAMDAENYQAYHILGIALDAQGDHKPAEAAFRQALEIWHGDPTPVLNNLGLNLASQGFLDEAAEVLRKALETSPDRMEVERNLRIVSALRESGGRAPSYIQEQRTAEQAAAKKAVPVPGSKPKAN
jgi:Flp pilus assembly protein TadD